MLIKKICDYANRDCTTFGNRTGTQGLPINGPKLALSHYYDEIHIEAHHIDTAALLLRLAFGLSIFAHGYNKMFGKGGIDRTAKWFASVGMRLPKLQARLASLTELGSGIALVLGLATPLAAAALIALMVVAIVVAHRHNGYFIFRPGQGWEYCASIAAVAAVIALLGPGEWSVDSALDLTYSNWVSFAVAIALGVGSAIAQLAIFWRPTRSVTSP